MQIIPAIDIIRGKAVRLTEGDYSQKKIYDDDPVAVAQKFSDAGFERLHLVDLDGAKAGQVQNLKVLESIAKKTNLRIDFGGGVRTTESASSVLNAGAWQCTVGSIAVTEPQLFSEWISSFGSEKFFVGADVRDETIRVSGWTEDSKLLWRDFFESMIASGVKEFFCTDISKDGKMEGPAVELYKRILNEFSAIHLFASGGVTSIDDILSLEQAGCKGAIVGKAIYEGLITLKELAQFNKSC